MKDLTRSSVLIASLALAVPAIGNPYIDLGGPASGFLAVNNIKNSSTQDGIEGKNGDGTPNPNHNGLPDYPNIQIPAGETNEGVWTAIIASPQSASSDYSVFGDEFYGGVQPTINNQTVTQSDFSTLSAGRIDYDNSQVAAAGPDTIAASELTFNFNTFEWDGVVDAEPRSNFTFTGAPINISPFSPVYTAFNDGSGAGNAQLFYQISIDNVTGDGLTFQDGELVSMDIAGDVTIEATAAQLAGFGSGTYLGTFSASGLDYAFDVSGTDAFAFFNGASLIMNRTGTASLVPEPTSLLMALAATATLVRRR